MVDVSRGWRAFGASVRGASHVKTGTPNQDAIACWPASDEPGPRAIAAVADGHGAPIHFRSARGASIAVTIALKLLAHADREDLSALPERIVAAWTADVRADLAREPFTEADWRAFLDRDEREVQDQVRENPLLAYGATLLASLVTADSALAVQIGDGDILAVFPDGRTARPLPGDDRLRNSYTTSLCGSNAAGDFRIRTIAQPDALPALIVLATDGYANSFNTEADFLRVGPDFLAMLEKQGADAVSRELGGFLTHASQHGSGDDVSAALLYRKQAAG